MQTPDQSRETQKKQPNWKVVAGVAAAAALGFSGLAVASPDRAQQGTPPAIELDDRRATAGSGSPAGPQGEWEVVGSPSFRLDLDDSLDSPLASADIASPDVDDSPVDSPVDSPDASPDSQTSSVVDDSPDDSPVDSPVDSPDDSPVDSPDDSPVDSPDDSADDSDD